MHSILRNVLVESIGTWVFRCYELSVAWIFFLIFRIRYSNIPCPSHLHRRPLFFCTALACTALCFSSYLLTRPSDSGITFLCAKCMSQQKIESSGLPKLLPRFRPEETKQDNATPGVLRDTSFFSRTVCSVLIVCKEKAETYAEIDQLLLLMYIHGERKWLAANTSFVRHRACSWAASVLNGLSAPPPFAGASADSCDGTPAQCFQSLLQYT